MLDVLSPYARGIKEPFFKGDISISKAPGGKMLLILMRFVSPTPASNKAASKALSSVEASPLPAVRK
jgi:hypothetical protein